MSNGKLTVAFVRRGYSPSGGAEAYLKRLAQGIVDLGHKAQLIATDDWPMNDWSFGSITRIKANSAIGFADEVEKLRPQIDCDVLMSLERVWRCDVYRAGDGVHRAWLNRRRKFEMPLQRFVRGINRKHRDILQLEESLFAKSGAGRVNGGTRRPAPLGAQNEKRGQILPPGHPPLFLGGSARASETVMNGRRSVS